MIKQKSDQVITTASTAGYMLYQFCQFIMAQGLLCG